MRPAIEAVIKHLSRDITGVEVGVYEGSNAADILASTNPAIIRKLYLVDIVELPKLKETISPHMGRIENLIPLSSQQACLRFKDNSFDFVYIDADHTYENCKQDLNIWWEKVKKNGILCGHDFCLEMLGVVKAVMEFTIQKNLQLNNIITYDPLQKTCSNSDWWVVK